MSTQIGTVAEVSGGVLCGPCGTDALDKKQLQKGDPIFKDSDVIVGNDGLVAIQLSNGQVITLGANNTLTIDDTLLAEIGFSTPSPESIESIVDEGTASVEALQAALLAGEDPSELEATAAGAGTGGEDEGSDFVLLDRSQQRTTPDSGFDTDPITVEFTPTDPELVEEPDEITVTVVGDNVVEGTPTPIFEERPVFESRPVFEEREITEERPVFEEREITEERPVFETRDITEERPVFEERPIFETREITEERPIIEKVPVEVTPIPHGISNVLFLFEGEGGVVGVKVDEYGGDEKNPAHPSQYIEELEAQYGEFVAYYIKAGQLFFDSQGNEIDPVAEGLDQYLSPNGNTFGGQGLFATVDQSELEGGEIVVECEEVIVGYETVVIGTEEVQVGTEQVQVGTEIVVVGTEQVQVGTEIVVVGTEQVQVGTEIVVIGTEQVQVGTEEVQVGTEQVLVGYTGDVLQGLDGVNNTIIGTGYDDVITDGNLNDTIVSGDGADKIVVTTGQDTVVDLSTTDSLVLKVSDVLNTEVTVVDNGSNTVISTSPNDSVILNGVTGNYTSLQDLLNAGYDISITDA